MSSAQTKLPAGKLPTNLLKRFLKKYITPSKDVIIGPGVGVDSAIIDFREGGYLVAKTDPVTLVAEDIGLYALHVNANDIAVMGGVPRWFLATVLLDEGTATVEETERIFSQLRRAARAVGVSLCGGHTEITPGINRPIVVGQMLGNVKKNRLVTTAGARTNDAIILTKGLAIEGTSIIARSKGEGLVKKGLFSKRFITRCRNFTKTPGLSVIKDAQTALMRGRVHAMHDPTEGGLATGLHELSIAAGRGVEVTEELIAVLPETQRLCAHFRIDPMGLIASGSLLAIVDPRDTGKVLKGYQKAGIAAALIGVMTGKKDGVIIRNKSGKRALKLPERDEITKIL